jgi:hypothetical protein
MAGLARLQRRAINPRRFLRPVEVGQELGALNLQVDGVRNLRESLLDPREKTLLEKTRVDETGTSLGGIRGGCSFRRGDGGGGGVRDRRSWPAADTISTSIEEVSGM